MDFGDVTQQGRLWPYQGVAAAIRDAIRAGELRPGQKLPAQQRLAQMAGVSKSAVQNALAVLRDEGFVRSVPRLGTFVAERKRE
jgi:DNA-binding GntR family transcriptional regulator